MVRRHLSGSLVCSLWTNTKVGCTGFSVFAARVFKRYVSVFFAVNLLFVLCPCKGVCACVVPCALCVLLFFTWKERGGVSDGALCPTHVDGEGSALVAAGLTRSFPCLCVCVCFFFFCANEQTT